MSELDSLTLCCGRFLGIGHRKLVFGEHLPDLDPGLAIHWSCVGFYVVYICTVYMNILCMCERYWVERSGCTSFDPALHTPVGRGQRLGEGKRGVSFLMTLLPIHQLGEGNSQVRGVIRDYTKCGCYVLSMCTPYMNILCTVYMDISFTP